LKGVNTDQVPSWEWIRPKGWRGTRVAVDWTKGEWDYRVIRHQKFLGTTSGISGASKLIILRKSIAEDKFTDAHIVGEEHHKGNQQEWIERVLGIDGKTFLNSVVFGQRMKRLIEATNDEKRKLFEGLFDLEFIAQARKVGTEKMKVCENANIKISTELVEQTRQLEDAKEDLLESEESTKKAQEEKQNKIRELQAEVEEVERAILTQKREITRMEENISKADFGAEKTQEEALKKLEKLLSTKEGELSKLGISLDAGAVKEKGEEVAKAKALKIQASEACDAAENVKLAEIDRLADEWEDADAALKVATIFRENSHAESEDIKREFDKINREIQTLKQQTGEVGKNCPACSQALPPEKVASTLKNIQTAQIKAERALEVLRKELRKREGVLAEATEKEQTTKAVADELRERWNAQKKVVVVEEQTLQKAKDALLQAESISIPDHTGNSE